MELMPVKIDILVRAKEAIAEMQKVNGELDRMAVKGELATGAMGKMQRASKLAGTALLGLGGIAAFVAYESVKSAMDLQASQTRLQQAVTNSKVSFAAAKPVIDQHAEAMANLGFTTVDTYQALGTLTTATRSPQMALDALTATADLARYKTMSLADAGKLLASASTGQARGLRDLGLALKKNIPAGASFAQILAIIEGRTHGMAKAFADTSAGKLEVLKAQFKSLEEQLGTALLPTFNKITHWIIKDGLPALKSLGKWFSENKPIIVAFTTALAVLWAVPKITGILTVLTTLGNAYLGLAGKADIAAASEAAATGGEVGVGVGAGAAAIGGAGLVAGGAIVGGAAVLAGSVYGAYTEEKKHLKPTMPRIGGKAGAAAMLSYQRTLKEWNATYGPDSPAAKAAAAKKKETVAPSGSLAGLGPDTTAASAAAKKKKVSLKSQTKLKVDVGTTSHTSVLKLDSKVLAKSTATSAAHGSPLATGHTK